MPGETWWADLSEPTGSEPRFWRAVAVVQCDAFNRVGRLPERTLGSILSGIGVVLGR